jgi:hypothetical protein
MALFIVQRVRKFLAFLYIGSFDENFCFARRNSGAIFILVKLIAFLLLIYRHKECSGFHLETSFKMRRKYTYLPRKTAEMPIGIGFET